MDKKIRGDPMIISASRRTDIPAFYSEWMINRFREGYVHTKNPMNPNQIKRIELSPDHIDCIVFWTKDPEPMLPRLLELDDMGYHYYFQFTLTPYDRGIERRLRDKKEILQTFKKLSDSIGEDRVLWRYDPILLNEDITIGYHKSSFEKLCRELQGYTGSCTISFIDLYAKLRSAVQEKLIRALQEEEMHQLSYIFSETGYKYGMELKACVTEEFDFSLYGITSAACIDPTIIEKICQKSIKIKKDHNQRKGCNCVQSTDIGIYNTCANGCVYCYANHSETSITKNNLLHDTKSSILINHVRSNTP